MFPYPCYRATLWSTMKSSPSFAQDFIHSLARRSRSVRHQVVKSLRSSQSLSGPVEPAVAMPSIITNVLGILIILNPPALSQ